MAVFESDRMHDAIAIHPDAVKVPEGYACPRCGTPLNYYSDIPGEYFYCPRCFDAAYDVETGELINVMY